MIISACSGIYWLLGDECSAAQASRFRNRGIPLYVESLKKYTHVGSFIILDDIISFQTFDCGALARLFLEATRPLKGHMPAARGTATYVPTVCMSESMPSLLRTHLWMDSNGEGAFIAHGLP